MKLVLIGAGGVGGWMASCLAPTLREGETLWIVDGDTVEERNLDRQRFTERDLGHNKARRLTRSLSSISKGTLRADDEYLSPVRISKAFNGETPDALLLAVDNHVARRTALELADVLGFPVFCGANEYNESSAWVYFPDWRGMAHDIRVIHPEILTGKEGDPLSPCTGDEAMEATPQLVTFNMLAASLAVQLYRHYLIEIPGRNLAEISDDLYRSLPVTHEVSWKRIFTTTIGDYHGTV